MPRNFVIVYRAREGSSALIDLLARHPGICVPVFEELDSYEAGKFCKPDQIGRLIGLTYVAGDRHVARDQLAGGAPQPGPKLDRAVGFKWRIWGDPELVAEALADQQVVVFHLFRFKLRELVTSLLFSDHVLPALQREGATQLPQGGHLQFELARKTPAERAVVRQQLAALRFRLDPAQFRATARDWLDGKRTIDETYLRPLRQRGVPVHSILYEDFCDNRAALLQRMCSEIGVDAALLAGLEPAYRRVHASSPSLQVENWAELNADPELRTIVAAWSRLIVDGHRYLGPARVDRGGNA